MNISVVLGVGLSFSIVYYVVTGEIKNPAVFLNPYAAMMVLGGTLAASLICFPLSQFVDFIYIFIRTFTGKGRRVILDTINEIVSLSEMANNSQPLESGIERVKNPFLKESLKLMQSGGLTDFELEEVLDKRVEVQNEKYKREGLTFKIIGKFPPAFGLIGASMGMIGLLQGLGQPDAFEKLGPSMSVALVATFYGLVYANFFLIPFGENLALASEEDLLMRRIVVDGVRLIKEEKHPLLVEEFLKSYISPRERDRIKKSKPA